MAIMIPSNPVEFDERSREGEMFESLEKLPDDYYVFHSMKIVEVKNNVLEEHEADYVVFNRTKGILVIEAKAGEVSCEDGIWRYESGLEMKMDPFRQANANMWRLKEYIEKLYGNTDITRNCKMLYCAWFPGINNKRLNKDGISPEGTIAASWAVVSKTRDVTQVAHNITKAKNSMGVTGNGVTCLS